MKLSHLFACCVLALGTASSSPLFASQVESIQTINSAASENIGYYRSPALHDDTLVFTAEGDLWVQQLGDPQARRLTSLPAEELGAAISDDGRQLAFVANYEGANEVYVMPLKGGVAKRVSFENSRVRVQGWTHDGQFPFRAIQSVH